MNNLIAKIFDYAKQNAPRILFGIGLAGTVTAGISAVKNTPKACKAIEKRKEELQVEKLPVKEVVKTGWKYYIGPITVELLSIASLITSDTMKNKKISGLVSLCTIMEEAASEYQEKVIETIGEKKEQKIRESIEEDRCRRMDPQEAIITGYGNTLFYDKYCGRTFLCDRQRLEEACLQLSKDVYSYDSADLNGLFDYINLDQTELGDWFVWDIDKMRKPSIKFKPRYGPAKNGDPMCIIGFDPEPSINRSLLRC